MTNAKAQRTPGHPAFEAFYHSWRGKTPANAIRLAIADHEATGHGIGDFTHALREAERIVEADAERDKITAALVAALRDLLKLCDEMRVFPPADSDQEREEWPTLVAARAALAAADKRQS